MNTRNTRHILLNRISKRKKQCRNGRFNTTKKLDYIKRKKDISKQIISKKDKEIRILLSIKHRLSNKRKEKMEI